MIKVDMEIKALQEEVTAIRRTLHQIPEPGFEVHKTRAYIIEYLKALDIDVYDQYGKTAVLGLLKGTEPGEAYGFRADMDALSIQEETSHDFQSKHEGFMHGCGHDGHMAALLGFAKYLSKRRALLKKDILFIFQPAEEGPGGAEVLIKESILEKFSVKEIYGMHLYPNVEEGIIAVRPGPMMAQNGEFDVYIDGESAHGAQPHNGVDAIVAASDYVMKVQSILTRFVNPIEPGVVTIGKMTGGERCNVIPKHVLLEGTIRTFSADVFETIKQKLEDFALAIEKGHGCKTKVVFRDMYPAVMNDKDLYQQFVEAVGSENIVDIDPQMLAEDFSFYQTRVPGVFFFMGTRNETAGHVFSLHHACFDFNEEVLLKVIQTYSHLLAYKGIIERG